MANHGYVACMRKVNLKIMKDIADKCNARVFKKLLTIKTSEENELYISCKHESSGSLIVWQTRPTSKKLEFRPQCWGTIMEWVYACFRNEFAVELKGKISDQGTSEKWHGTAGKFDTYQKFFDVMHPLASGPTRKFIYEVEFQHIPAAFKEAGLVNLIV